MKVPTEAEVAKIIANYSPPGFAFMAEQEAKRLLFWLRGGFVPVLRADDRSIVSSASRAARTLKEEIADMRPDLLGVLAGFILSHPEEHDLPADAEKLSLQLKILVDALEATEKAVQMRKIREDANSNGIRVKAMALEVWQGKPPGAGPRDGDPFLKYLADLLLICEVEGDARSVYASFLRYNQKFHS